MKALTLWRPWPWAIFHAPSNPKRVENRGWRPPAWLIGERFAIHAGQRFDAAALDFIDEVVGAGATCPPAQAGHPTGIIGTARLVGWVDDRVKRRWSPSLDAAQARDALLSPWTMRGGVAWVLDDVVVLPEPLPCKGRQGLWDAPAELVAEVAR